MAYQSVSTPRFYVDTISWLRFSTKYFPMTWYGHEIGIDPSNVGYGTWQGTTINLAEWSVGIPLIYYPHGLEACAIRFKNSLQENTKMHALAEDVLEASHNGIVSWERKSKVQPIILRGKDDYIKTKERWQIFKEYFKKSGIELL